MSRRDRFVIKLGLFIWIAFFMAVSCSVIRVTAQGATPVAWQPR